MDTTTADLDQFIGGARPMTDAAVSDSEAKTHCIRIDRQPILSGSRRISLLYRDTAASYRFTRE